ncbi:MAG: PAS domain-containing protein [Bdellovibrionales bacterium]|nr:PAS domain-containing protein [Ramlibacter sp.]
MPQTFDLTSHRAGLRQRATAKLSGGAQTDPTSVGMPQALTVLYQLASSPSTASDALALLHELQVHQVELDMQQEGLHLALSEVEEALVRKTALVDHAPVGFLIVDAGTVVREINFAGARLLHTSPEELLDRPLAGLLSVPSADALHLLLVRARDGLMPETCKMLLPPIDGVIRAVHATASKDTIPECFLLVLMAVA